MRKRNLLVIAILATLAGLLFGGAATAGSLITSKQIKDHSIKYKDLRKNAAKKLKGQTGPAGVNGTNGVNGKNGLDGKNGVDGEDGLDGVDGEDGRSAYQTWLSHHNDGTEDDFLASLVGEQGPQGEPGADSTVPGPQGEPGVQGPSGVANVHVVAVTTPNDNATASCPAGEVLLGGGGEATGPNAYLVYSKPVGSTWAVKSKTANNTSAYAVCAA